MKRFVLGIIFLSAIFSVIASCNTVKKTTLKESTKDSVSVKQVSGLSVNKKDSTGQSTTTSEKKTSGQNSYTKQTTVKEYYGNGDELDIAYSVDTVRIPVPGIVDSIRKPNLSSNKLKYRETTILETGTSNTLTEDLTISSQQSDLKKIDSTRKDKSDSIHVRDVKIESTSIKKSKGFMLGVSGIFVAGFVIWFVFFRKKKE